MRLSITHDTTYRYEDRVRASIQYLRLTPQDSERQHVVDWRLDLPRPARPLRDPYGNILHVLTLDEPHESVLIAAHGLVEIDEEREVEHDRQSPLPFLRSTRLTGADAEMRAFAERAMGGRKDRGGLLDLMHALHEHILYQPGATRVDSTAIEAFGARAGVCQDHAHAFLACIRSQGVPGRYVSGYLYTEDDTHLASHAWAEAWLGDGWYSFDVTNRLGRPERHLSWPSASTTWMPARCAACAVAAVASRCMRGCWSARRCCRCSNSDDPLRAWRYRRLPLRLRGGDGRNKEDSR